MLAEQVDALFEVFLMTYRRVKLMTQGFRLTPEQYKQFKAMLPGKGDRSRALSKFVDMFIAGEIHLRNELVVSGPKLHLPSNLPANPTVPPNAVIT